MAYETAYPRNPPTDRNPSSTADDVTGAIRDTVSNAANAAADTGRAALGRTQEATEDVAAYIKRLAEEKPITLLVGTAATALAIGALWKLSSRRATSSYFDAREMERIARGLPGQIDGYVQALKNTWK